MRIFSINFDKASVLPKSMQREIVEHGWPVASRSAYPYLHKVDADLVVVPNEERDLLLAAASAEAVARFVGTHWRELEQPAPASVREKYVLDELPGSPQVTIVAPHPETEWPQDDEEEDADLGDTEREIEIEAARKVVKAFVREQKKLGKDPAWLVAAGMVCESLYEFKVNYANAGHDAWDGAVIDEYLLDYYPRKLSVEDDMIERTPEVLVAFFEWLGATDRVPVEQARALAERIGGKRKRFLREARDPRNFGMAKSFVMGALSAGVDLSNQKDIDRYLAATNAGVVRNPYDPPSLPFAATAPVARLRARRWVWSGSGSPPDPRAPCPCGSGQRYKKCCMPTPHAG